MSEARRPCTSCGHIVPKKDRVCPICNTKLTKEWTIARTAALFLAALVFLGTFLPWLYETTPLTAGNYTTVLFGLDTLPGRIVACVGIAILVTVRFSSKKTVQGAISIIGGLLCGLVGCLTFIDYSERIEDKINQGILRSAQVGEGLYLVLVASVGLLVAGIILLCPEMPKE